MIVLETAYEKIYLTKIFDAILMKVAALLKGIILNKGSNALSTCFQIKMNAR